jgi:hypothetical protein
VKCHRTPVVSPCERATLCQPVEALRPLRQVGPSDDVFDLAGEETALDHELDVEVVMRRQHTRGCPTKHTDYDTGSPHLIDEPNEVERGAQWMVSHGWTFSCAGRLVPLFDACCGTGAGKPVCVPPFGSPCCRVGEG